MFKIGIPEQLIRHIYMLYHNRKLFVRARDGLSQSRNAQSGLPQGSILSPILYVIYTHDLEKLFPADVRIIQFADDVCIYVTDKTIQKCNEKLSTKFDEVLIWLNENGLTLSPQKSVICSFSRNRSPLPNSVNFGNMTIPYRTTVKYLGVYLDRKLIWKDHIQFLLKRTENGLNIIRTFSHQKWGADPNICLLFYKTFIRSVLDYSSIFYGSAADTHLRKLENIKNKCLRQSIGFLRSTPINVIEVEATEPPLSLRRSFVSDKFLLKMVSKDSKIVNKINELTILGYTHTYWRAKKLPLLVESYSWITQFKDQIYSSKLLPYFQLNDFYMNNIPKIIIPKTTNENPYDLKSQFLENINTIWSNYEHIFTDGSVMENRTGCAFYHKNLKKFKKYRLPNNTSIYSAELWAILEALKYSLNYTENNLFIIFTDSKSSLTKLENCVSAPPANHLIKEILNTYNLLINSNKFILLVWVKAHIGILENEIADKLAKEATQILIPVNEFKIPYTDIYRKAREIMMDDWQTQYSNSDKGLYYKNMFPFIQKKPWFSSVSNRSFIRTICRIRSNHALYPKYKKKIGLQNHENCECGEMGDLEHYILSCSRLTNHKNVLINSFKDLVDQPFNINHVISLNNLKIYSILYKYITEANLKL